MPRIRISFNTGLANPACLEATIWGGCPGRNDHIAPRSFFCPVPNCPVIARCNALYGIKATAPRLGVHVLAGTAAILPFPAANDNK